MPKLWKLIEKVGQSNYPIRLEPGDQCYYAREYISGGGYKASDANQLIFNFKKLPQNRGQKDWHYKEEAILRFAKELDLLLPSDNDFLIAAMPSSLSVSDPNYDTRLEDTLICLNALRGDELLIEHPFASVGSIQSSHTGGSRKPDEIIRNLKWVGLRNTEVDTIVLIDDVITTGGHYKACQRLIKRHHPEIEVVGAFWVRTVWPSGSCEI